MTVSGFFQNVFSLCFSLGAFSQIPVINDLLFHLFELYLLDLICSSPGVT